MEPATSKEIFEVTLVTVIATAVVSILFLMPLNGIFLPIY